MTRQLRFAISMIALMTTAPAAHAGFGFSFFRLRTGTQDRTGPSFISDVETISTPDNEIHALLDTGVGTGYARTQYDVSWLGYTGIFNTAVDQHIAEPDFLTTAEVRIEFFAEVDLRIVIDSEVEFSSSAADLADIRYSFLVRDLGMSFPFFFNDEQDGGSLALNPPTGTFSTHESFVLPAGTTYRIIHDVDLNSIVVNPPQHAPIDISGYINFSLTPVPEPTTVLPFAGAAAVLFRRRRRDWEPSVHDALPSIC